jgi:hypothetical protein
MAATTVVQPPTVQKISVPIALNKPIERQRFFIFLVDLLTELVDKKETYAMLSPAERGLTVFLGDHESTVLHAQRGGAKHA